MGLEKERRGLISRLREKGAGDPLKCIQCGSCTSACIVNLVEEAFNPRKIIGSIARFSKAPDQDPWLCSACSLCVERCPQGVNPLSVIMALRMVEYENGNTPPDMVIKLVEQVKNTGLAFPLSEDVKERRRLLGLPEPGLSEEGLSQVRKILSEAGV